MKLYEEMELTHHGILGQKWGVRRFQNKDGTLTPAGRRRLAKMARSKNPNKFVDKVHDKLHGTSIDIADRQSVDNAFETFPELKKYANDYVKSGYKWDVTEKFINDTFGKNGKKSTSSVS